jgi:hypothetical protein
MLVVARRRDSRSRILDAALKFAGAGHRLSRFRDQVEHRDQTVLGTVNLNGNRLTGPTAVANDVGIAGRLALPGWPRPDLDDGVRALETNNGVDTNAGRGVRAPLRPAIAVVGGSEISTNSATSRGRACRMAWLALLPRRTESSGLGAQNRPMRIGFSSRIVQ